MRYGLSDQTIQQINSIFAKHPTVKQAVLYGSRAKGTYKPGSDIDLTLFGEDLSQHEVDQIVDELDALDLPYTLDLSVFKNLAHAKLRDHIARVGVIFYQRCIADMSKNSTEMSGLDSSVECEKHGAPKKCLQNYAKDKMPLGKIFEFRNGRGFKKSEWKNSGLPIIRITNLNNQDSSFNYYSGAYDKDIEVNNGDLLFSWSGTVGSSFGAHLWTGSTGLLNQHIFKVKHGKNIIRKYGYYALQWITDQVEKQVNGAVGLVHITKAKLNEFEVPLPTINKQKCIVSILDDAFERIDTAIVNTEKNLSNAKELFKSYLDNIFFKQHENWLSKKLGNMLSLQPRNGWSPPADHHSDHGTPVLTLSSVTGFQFNKDAIKYTTAEVGDTSHYWVENGDLLITRSNTHELVGHVAICEGLEEKTIYPDLIMRMKVDNKLANTKFIYYQLMSTRLRTIIQESATGANPTMKKIKKSTVQGLPIFVPNLTTQKNIVLIIDKLNENSMELSRKLKSKLEALTRLKNSLLRKAFSGELTADFNPDTLEH